MNRNVIQATATFGAGCIVALVLTMAGARVFPAPSVSLPDRVVVGDAPWAKVQANSWATVKWFSPDPRLAVLEWEGNTVLVSSRTKGSYKLYAYAARWNKLSEPVGTVVVIGDDPGPEPGPDPGPVPPNPTGNRVLMVYESAELSKLPPAQLSILQGKLIRDYLEQRCDQDGTVKAYRIWDKDVSTANVSQAWKDAMARPRKSLPWLYINGPKAVFEGPLPANETEALNLLKKYLG